MSVIAAKVYDDHVKIAADSIIVRGYFSKRVNNFTKLIKKNGMIIGSTGSCEEASFMWNYMGTHKPKSATEEDVLAFLIEFAEYKNKIGAGSKIENSYLLVFKGRLFHISNMFVQEIEDYIAVGAGEDFSNAAMYLGHDPEKAVKTACELCCFVSEPIISYTQNRN